jgi:hypothetical protein
MLLSAVSVLVVAQSSSEIPEGLMNSPVIFSKKFVRNTNPKVKHTWKNKQGGYLPKDPKKQEEGMPKT